MPLHYSLSFQIVPAASPQPSSPLTLLPLPHAHTEDEYRSSSPLGYGRRR